MSESNHRPIWFKDSGSDVVSETSLKQGSESNAPQNPAIDEVQIARFLAGEDAGWDTMLLPYDIRASIAHARGLEQAGIIPPDDLQAIEGALGQLQSDWLAGLVTVTPADEDCHTVIERFLVQKIGEAGKRIHTGRSRNDQVLAALRLYMVDRLESITATVGEMAEALCGIADRYPNQPLPGYTHFQRAMPSTVALWALGFAELLCSDLQALLDARAQISTSPLGSAAGFGVPFFNLPREFVAQEMGMERVQYHATSVQLSRGKLEMHAVHALLQVAQTINRLSADVVQFFFLSVRFSRRLVVNIRHRR